MEISVALSKGKQSVCSLLSRLVESFKAGHLLFTRSEMKIWQPGCQVAGAAWNKFAELPPGQVSAQEQGLKESCSSSVTSRQDLEWLDNSRIFFMLKCWAIRGEHSIPFESKHSSLFVLLLVICYLSCLKKKTGILKTQSKTDSGDILEGLWREENQGE